MAILNPRSAPLRKAGQRPHHESGPRRFALGCTLLCLAFATGCARLPERNAVPPELEQQAVIAGIPGARITGRMTEAQMIDNLERARVQQRAAGLLEDAETAMLALSGGGANGAFGAGLLTGWSDEGSRPTFNFVTGVSTGALIAPFAFLGSEYDGVIEELYTTTATSGIIEKRSLLSALGSDALSDSGPLKRRVASVIDEELLARIAVEHRRGRRLLVGTTNLDAGRGVIWDLGEIAASGQPGALQLFRDVLVASAAIPVAFPPVYIDVEVDGQPYREMHVDGGVTAQAFIYPPHLEMGRIAEETGFSRKPSLYVIRNSTLWVDVTTVSPRLGAIAARSIDMLIKQQSLGDLVRIYSTAQRDGLAFHIAYIPAEVEDDATEAFDPAYMKKLFDLGYQLALSGDPWKREILKLEEAR